MSVLTVDGRHIGDGERPLIIAELSGNHKQDLTRAMALVDAAASAGADAVKLQTYTPDSLSLPVDAAQYTVKTADSPWSGRSVREIYAEACLPYDWHEPLFARARALGMLAFSSVFDLEGLALLEALDCPLYKIASPELTHWPLIDAVLATGKPLILSTGSSNAEEIESTVGFVAGRNALDRTIVLHCVSAYPTPLADMNLHTMSDMAWRFGLTYVGLSDHSQGTTAAATATALGARVIEKHLTLRRADGGSDAFFSLEPDEFRNLVTACRATFDALGAPAYGQSDREKQFLSYRHRFVAAAPISRGEPLGPSNLRSIRASEGVPTRAFAEVFGRAAAVDIPQYAFLSKDMIASDA